MYVRPNLYPNGDPIPDSLPLSYQPASQGDSPPGQYCFNCRYFSTPTRYCERWDAYVKPKWWCGSWEKGPIEIVKTSMKPQSVEIKPYKRIATSIIEEHFSEQPKPKNNNMEWDEYENEKDTIKLDVPLLIRLLEYSREDAKSDVDLHLVAERLIELSEYGDVLDMSNYEDIVNPESKD